MQSSKYGVLVAALLLAAGILTIGCPPSAAQDTIRRLPAAGDDFAYPPLDAPGAPFAGGPAWELPVSEATGLTWPQRIVQLTQGRMQLEGGYSYLSGPAGTEGAQHALPDLLLRYGVTNRLELRVGWPGFVSRDTDDPTTSGSFNGTLNPNVGLVYDLWDQIGLLPQTAVLAAVPVPLEGNPFALNSLQPLTELLVAWQIGDLTTLTGRSGLAIFESDGDNYTQWQQGVSVDTILTERFGAFVTWDMLANHGSWNDNRQHMAGGGLSWRLTQRLVVSWRAAVGLNSAAPDFLNDVRFAYRF